MESWNQWNQTTFYNLGQPGHLAKLHLAVSQSLLAQEDIAWLWVACGEKLDKIKIKNSTKLFSVTQLTRVTQLTQVTQMTQMGVLSRKWVVGQFCDFF